MISILSWFIDNLLNNYYRNNRWSIIIQLEYKIRTWHFLTDIRRGNWNSRSTIRRNKCYRGKHSRSRHGLPSLLVYILHLLRYFLMSSLCMFRPLRKSNRQGGLTHNFHCWRILCLYKLCWEHRFHCSACCS